MTNNQERTRQQKQAAKPAKPLLELAKRRSFDFFDGGAIQSDRGAGSGKGVSSLPSKSQTRSRSSNVKWHSGQRFIARIANSNIEGEAGAGVRLRASFKTYPYEIGNKKIPYISGNGQP